jgi:hypothetical protein
LLSCYNAHEILRSNPSGVDILSQELWSRGGQFPSEDGGVV